MLTDKFFEVLKFEGVVTILSWGGEDEPNIVNTWNSYLLVKDETIYLPVAGMSHLQANLKVNNRIKMTLGSREVMGNNNYQGTGFLIEGKASFLDSGEIYDEMKSKFTFAKRVLKVEVLSSKQLL